MSSVAGKLGFGEAFNYKRPADIFREHAALSARENNGERLFNLAGLANLSDAGYEALTPVQWPVLKGSGAETERSKRLFSDGRFVTDNQRARFVAIETQLAAQQTE